MVFCYTFFRTLHCPFRNCAFDFYKNAFAFTQHSLRVKTQEKTYVTTENRRDSASLPYSAVSLTLTIKTTLTFLR